MGGCFGVNTKSSSVSEEAGLLSAQTRRIITLERDPSGVLDPDHHPAPILVPDASLNNDQRIAARLFSPDTAKLFQKTESESIVPFTPHIFTPGSEIDLKITCSPKWPSMGGHSMGGHSMGGHSIGGLITERSTRPITLTSNDSSSSDALNPTRSDPKLFSGLWSSGKSSIRIRVCSSGRGKRPSRRLSQVGGSNSSMDGHLLQTSDLNLVIPNSGLPKIEGYNFSRAGDDSPAADLFINADSSSDVLKIHDEEDEVPKTYNNAQESSSDQLFEDNFMVNAAQESGVISPLVDVDSPKLHDFGKSLSPLQQDESIIICGKASTSPGIFAQVETPTVQEVLSPSSAKVILNGDRSDSSEIITFNELSPGANKQVVNSVDVDEKSLIITSFDGHKAQTKSQAPMRGQVLDDDLSLTDRILEMPFDDDQPNAAVFHDGDSSTDPIDFGEDKVRDKQPHRCPNDELSASDQIVFENKRAELNKPFGNDESSSDPINFEGSIENQMEEPFGASSDINNRNKKSNVKDKREQKQASQNDPAFAAESSSEIFIGGDRDTRHSAVV